MDPVVVSEPIRILSLKIVMIYPTLCNLEYLSGRVNIMMYSAIMNIPSGCGRDLVYLLCLEGGWQVAYSE